MRPARAARRLGRGGGAEKEEFTRLPGMFDVPAERKPSGFHRLWFYATVATIGYMHVWYYNLDAPLQSRWAEDEAGKQQWAEANSK